MSWAAKKGLNGWSLNVEPKSLTDLPALLWPCTWVCCCTTGTRLLCQSGCCSSSSAGSVKPDWDHSVHWQERHETLVSFDLKFSEKQEGWADMLVPDWIAQRRCAWTCLKISIFLTIAAAHQKGFKYLKSLHSASWDEVFPQSRDLNSISAALKNLNTWTETQIILVLWTEKEICFHQVCSMFFFPPKLHFYATSASGNCSPFITSWFPLSLQARSASSW